MTGHRPPEVSANSARPSTARIYDYYLGGTDNYKVDRDTADQMMATVPESIAAVRANRSFLTRAVRFLTGAAGIGQFLDIGSGLPTRLNVHQVAQGIAPQSRIVYVDNDPVVRAYGDALLNTTKRVRFALRDLRRPAELLADPVVQELIDFERPVAVLLVAILPFLPDSEDPEGILARLREVMAPGSYLVISHVADGPRPRAIAEIQQRAGAQAWTPRSRARITGFFEGFELVEPGVTVASRWRPTHLSPGEPEEQLSDADTDDNAEKKINWILAGVGRKR